MLIILYLSFRYLKQLSQSLKNEATWASENYKNTSQLTKCLKNDSFANSAHRESFRI